MEKDLNKKNAFLRLVAKAQNTLGSFGIIVIIIIGILMFLSAVPTSKIITLEIDLDKQTPSSTIGSVREVPLITYDSIKNLIMASGAVTDKRYNITIAVDYEKSHRHYNITVLEPTKEKLVVNIAYAPFGFQSSQNDTVIVTIPRINHREVLQIDSAIKK